MSLPLGGTGSLVGDVWRPCKCRGEYSALGGVDALCPLVMYLWVSKFVGAFGVVNCFLFLHVCVEEPGSCVVGELTEEVLGFIGCAR